jgi:proteasome lid subunit RPN8/RPN11
MLPLVLAALIGVDFEQLDARVVDYFTDVAMRGFVQNHFTESAAFIVADQHRNVRCLVWPPTNAYRKQTFHGTIPPGTIAIVHTHPMETPEPSEADIQQARDLHLPMYVLTRKTIMVVPPYDGDAISVLKGRYWMTDAIERRCEEFSTVVGETLAQ